MYPITKVFLVCTLAAGVALLSACGDQASHGEAPHAAAAPQVTVVTIKPHRVSLTTTLPGRTSAFLVSEVRPQADGIIQKRLFEEGANVKAGDVLYQIDPDTYRAAYDNAKASLAKAEANAIPARLNAKRYVELVKAHVVSQQDDDDIQAAMFQADAEVQAAKAALESARINLDHTRVLAPISGRIGKSVVTPGALVTANQQAVLATIQQTDPIYVDLTQSSSEVMRLRRDLASENVTASDGKGPRVKLLLEDGREYGSMGTLQFSDITVDQNTGSITLRALFPNTNGELLPGLYVRAVLEEGMKDNAIVVPVVAVIRDAKGNSQVMVVSPENTVEARSVQLDRIVDDKWLVTSGLAAGDRLIIEGHQMIAPGTKVEAIEVPPAAVSASVETPAQSQ